MKIRLIFLNNFKSYYFYGNGGFSKRFIQTLTDNGIKTPSAVLGLTEKDGYDGFNLLLLDEKKYCVDLPVVVCSDTFYDEISRRLVQYGFFKILSIANFDVLSRNQFNLPPLAANIDYPLPTQNISKFETHNFSNAIYYSNTETKSSLSSQCNQLKKELVQAGLYLESAKKNVLHICHDLGGGTELFVNNLITDLRNEGVNSFVLRPSNDSCAYVDVDITKFPLFHFSVKEFSSSLATFFSEFNITYVHIHHLIGYDSGFSNCLTNVCKNMNIDITCTLHDFSLICSNINLVSENRICTKIDFSSCDLCSKKNNDISPKKRIENCRELFYASKIITAPSNSVKHIFNSIFNDINIKVIPHSFKPIDCKYNKQSSNSDPSMLRVGVVGNVQKIKGFDVIVNLAIFCVKNKKNLKLFVIGNTYDNLLCEKYGIEVTGGYRGYDSLVSEISRNEIDILFLPSICCETYSYTYSECLNIGLPIAIFDVGAPAERAKKMGLDFSVIPYSYKDNSEKLVRSLYEVASHKYNYSAITDCIQVSPLLYYENH